MRTLLVMTHQDIMDCVRHQDSSPHRVFGPGWEGTALNVLEHPLMHHADALWIALQRGWLPPELLRMFAVYCARAALAALPAPDDADRASYQACEVAERYAKGESRPRELQHAHDAALAVTMKYEETPQKFNAAFAAAFAVESDASDAAIWSLGYSVSAIGRADFQANIEAFAAHRKHLIDMIHEWLKGTDE